VEIEKAIPECATLLFVVTRDSIAFQSECRRELDLAVACKRPIIPVRLHADAQMPYRCLTRQHIDFTGNFDTALEELRQHLLWLASPKGTLRALKDRLDDAKHDLRHARDETQRIRIDQELWELQKQITEQERIVADPQGAAIRTITNIGAGIERERMPAIPVAHEAGGKFINPPPTTAPTYFQDREVETQLIVKFLRNEGQRLMTIVGRGGVGKTAMVCRLLHKLENGQVPDPDDEVGTGQPLHHKLEDGLVLDGKRMLQAAGIVYLSAVGLHRINMANFFSDLCKLVPTADAEKLDAVYKSALSTVETKMTALLDSFRSGRVVVLLDNFEDLIDPETQNIRDPEIAEALNALLILPQHAVKVIITTRIAPRDLALVQSARQVRLELDEGLPSPFAENILRAMDADGKVGLKTAAPELLRQAQERTRGYPRALEALFAILSADRGTSLNELLEDSGKRLPANVVEDLVGQAFNRLDNAARQVMQALAIYARPVPPVAIDYLLQPHLPDVDSAPVLKRLVNMHYVRKEAGRFLLHPIDREYALSRLAADRDPNRQDGGADFSQRSLRLRAAAYFETTRTPRDSWKTIADLAPQVNEFDLRCAAGDYDTAASVLLQIDWDYLYVWGHYRAIIETHERLRGNLSEPVTRILSLGTLGSAYGRMAYVAEAIKCQNEALTAARAAGYRNHESALLNNLAIRYCVIGQTNCAIEHAQKSLQIATEDRLQSEASSAERTLGDCKTILGQFDEAVAHYDQSLQSARTIHDQRKEAIALERAGQAQQDLKQFDKSSERYREAIVVADRIGLVEVQNSARYGLALGYLSQGDVASAHANVKRALAYDFQENAHRVLLIQGIIALAQGERGFAIDTFVSAMRIADEMLARCNQLYAVLYTKAMASCGQAICGGPAHLSVAEDSFRSARAIVSSQGVQNRIQELFRIIEPFDSTGTLRKVRKIAAG